MTDDDVEDLTLLELQRERLRSARARQETLGLIREAMADLAKWSRWGALAIAAHAGLGVLQDPPNIPALILLTAALGLVIHGRAWRRR